jgi:hypothetical protein
LEAEHSLPSIVTIVEPGRSHRIDLGRVGRHIDQLRRRYAKKEQKLTIKFKDVIAEQRASTSYRAQDEDKHSSGCAYFAFFLAWVRRKSW